MDGWSFLAQALPPQSGAMVLLVGAGALVLATVVFVAQVLARREQRRELRELVLALEELRAGRLRRRLEVHPRSALAVLADVVNRLSQDLHARDLEWSRTKDELEAFLQAAGDLAIVHADADWDVRGLGGAAAQLLQWNEGELFARPVEEIFAPEAWRELLPKLARRSLRDQGIHTRTLVRRRDGSCFEAQLTIHPKRTAAGDVSGYVLLLRDISAQVRLENEREQARLQYTRLLESIPEGVVVLEGGAIAYGNAAGAALLGLARADELRGLKLQERVALGDLLVVQEALERSAREGVAQHAVCGLTGSRGEPLARVRLECRPLPDGERRALLVVLVDETAVELARAAAARTQAQIEAALDALPEAVGWFEGEGAASLRLVLANAALAELARAGREDLEGLSPQAVAGYLAAAGVEAVARWLQAAGEERREATIELQVGDGLKAFEALWLPARARGGEAQGALLVLRDRSHAAWLARERQAEIQRLRDERSELEQAQARVERELEQLRRRCAQLEQLQDELRRLDRMKSELLANVSHELQTPLVSIKGYTEMILKERLGPINEEQRKGLSLALRNIDRLISMIDELLMVSRLESQIGELKRTVFPLRPVVEEALTLLRESIEAKGLTAEVGFADPQIRVEGDREKILQVFLNLLSNAVKFNREGGRIEVSARPLGEDWLEVRVSDTGVGIAPEELERIFDRYYRAGAGEPGTGIGLAIVRDILRLHGGTIRAESRPGEGTTFIFTLPREADGRGSGQSSSRDDTDESAGSGGPANTHDSPATGGRGTSEEDPGGRPRLRIIRRHVS